MLCFALSLASKDVVLIVLAAVAVVALVGWLFRKDTAIEMRRREAIQLTAELRALGLERLAGFAECYAVGDYSGLYGEAKQLARELSDHDKALSLLRSSFFKQLPERLKRDADREEILRIVAAFQAERTAEPKQPPASGA